MYDGQRYSPGDVNHRRIVAFIKFISFFYGVLRNNDCLEKFADRTAKSTAVNLNESRRTNKQNLVLIFF